MELSDKVALLSRHFIFQHLPAVDLERIAQYANQKHYAAGQTIFRKGDDGASMMLVVKGKVRISAISMEGKEITLNLLEEGGILGEIAMIDGGERSADAVALENTTVLTISQGEFRSLLKNRPDLAVQVLVLLCQKLRKTSDALESLGLLPVPARLARFLLKLSDEQGQSIPSGVLVPLRLSQGEIGRQIGATRESVNKQFGAWQSEGLIRLERNQVVLTNLKHLKVIAELGP
jgi:CRP/FNR family cyclic AMP-dependent transcriptional regulator